MNMNVNDEQIYHGAYGIAKIQNLAQCFAAVKRTMERNPLLPGISAFYGPSGFGKSTAANHVATKTDAFYVQVRSTDTKKTFMQSLLREMSIPAPKTLGEMMNLASSELAKSQRPLIIDEFDHLVKKNFVEMVRDLYEASQCTILIIGEEQLARNLERWERFHGRVLNWVPALPCDITDAKLLAQLYAPRLMIDDAVLTKLVASVKGSTRRVSTNLEMLNEAALEEGIDHITPKTVKELLTQGFVTGESPKPRSF